MFKCILKLLGKGLSNLTSNRFEFFLTLIAVTLVSFLGLFLLLLAHNLQQTIIQDKGIVQFAVYWKKNVPLKTIRQDWKSIRLMDSIQSQTGYTPEKSLKVLGDSMGKNVDLSWFRQQNNPLPATALVSLALKGPDPEQLTKKTLEHLKAIPGVETVHYNPLELNTAGSWIVFLRSVLWPLMALLALLVGLIVGNTIKLSQLQYQREIEVLRLVGGARWFIMLPLLSGGAFLAMLGASLGLLFVKIAQRSLNSVLNSPPLWLEVYFLPWSYILWTFLMLASVALLFSWVNIKQ